MRRHTQKKNSVKKLGKARRFRARRSTATWRSGRESSLFFSFFWALGVLFRRFSFVFFSYYNFFCAVLRLLRAVDCLRRRRRRRRRVLPSLPSLPSFLDCRQPACGSTGFYLVSISTHANEATNRFLPSFSELRRRRAKLGKI